MEISSHSRSWVTWITVVLSSVMIPCGPKRRSNITRFVNLSTALKVSSKMRSAGRNVIARAKVYAGASEQRSAWRMCVCKVCKGIRLTNRCFSPPLICEPPLPIVPPLGCEITKSLKAHASATLSCQRLSRGAHLKALSLTPRFSSHAVWSQYPNDTGARDTLPALGETSPSIPRSSNDLPHPTGPVITICWPLVTLRVTFFNRTRSSHPRSAPRIDKIVDSTLSPFRSSSCTVKGNFPDPFSEGSSERSIGF